MSRVPALVLVVLATSCSTYTPPRPIDVRRETPLSVSAELAWQNVIRYFSDHNIPIDIMDHSSFFIKTRPVDLTATYGGVNFAANEMPIRNAWCDCGSASLKNVWSSSNRIRLSFNVVLEKRSDTSSVLRVNTFFEGVKLGKRSLYASGYDTEISLTCVSTGKLESDLAAFLGEVRKP